MLYDQNFLTQLDKQKNKIIYAKITSLQFNEYPIETIEGRVTSGTINIDGSSSMRRTCSLTLVTDKIDLKNYYWGVKTKFKLEIGISNKINSQYPDIIWFKQGIFVITMFNTSLSTDNLTINIQGKDKMCLLNGEIGGTLHSSVDFGKIEQIDSNGNIIIKKYPLKDIIRESVHQYGGEFFHNIIINDLDDLGLELLKYNYDDPLYLLREVDDDTYFGGTFDGKQLCWLEKDQEPILLSEIEQYDLLVQSLAGTVPSTQFYLDINSSQLYCAAKIVKNQTAGYKTTDLVYNGDLIANVGESLTSILDKIKNMLGNFEYFYDIDGRFVFQRKVNIINTVWTPQIKNEDEITYVESTVYTSNTIYNFQDNYLLTSINNTPDLTNIKNDYSVWGIKNTVNNTGTPIHMRYAIDEKPQAYTTINVTAEELENYNKKYGFNIKPQKSERYSIEDYDWRELIYQMALDYQKFNHLDNFELKIIEANKEDKLYFSGKTGYEQYYIDLLGFWRQLYNPDLFIKKETGILGKDILSSFILGEGNLSKSLILQAVSNSISNYSANLEDYYPQHAEHPFWAIKVYENPEELNFWFDFLAEGEIQRFSNQMIGNRPKAINDNKITSIYFKDTPSIIFTTLDKLKSEEKQPGYRYFIGNNLDDMFSRSAQGKSAKNMIDELLYKHSYCMETISLNAIPIYYLEPNNRIYIFDKETNINDYYVINKITISLNQGNNMTIVANKIIQ